MSDDAFDVVVLGGGPGGYASALYGASAGLRIALVEEGLLGGTCLNRGCIPAKGLLHAAEVYRTIGHAAEYGFGLPDGGSATIDWPGVNRRKARNVDQLRSGLGGLLKRRKVTVVQGHGRLTADGAVAVGDRVLRGRAVVVCTGSVPRSLPGLEIDGHRVISSDQATNHGWDRLPERIAVIGGGVSGSEFTSTFTDLGVRTTLLEAMLDGVLPVGPDRDVAAVLARSLTKRGAEVHAGARVGPPEVTDRGVVLPFEAGGESAKIEVDQVLVAIGRRPLTEDAGLAEAGVTVTDRGFVEIDPATMRTSRDGVYAVGDCVATPGLAHVAYAEGMVAIHDILGEDPAPVDYAKVPWVVYTHPEVAWAGLTEAEAREAGHDVEVHKHAMAGNGRAMILGDTDGLVKVVAQRGGPILGVHLVGPWASELIAEGYLAVNWEALPAEVAHLVHPHPSLSESIGETMITFSGRSLH